MHTEPSPDDESVAGLFFVQYDILDLKPFCADKNVYTGNLLSLRQSSPAPFFIKYKQGAVVGGPVVSPPAVFLYFSKSAKTLTFSSRYARARNFSTVCCSSARRWSRVSSRSSTTSAPTAPPRASTALLSTRRPPPPPRCASCPLSNQTPLPASSWQRRRTLPFFAPRLDLTSLFIFIFPICSAPPTAPCTFFYSPCPAPAAPCSRVSSH